MPLDMPNLIPHHDAAGCTRIGLEQLPADVLDTRLLRRDRLLHELRGTVTQRLVVPHNVTTSSSPATVNANTNTADIDFANSQNKSRHGAGVTNPRTASTPITPAHVNNGQIVEFNGSQTSVRRGAPTTLPTFRQHAPQRPR